MSSDNDDYGLELPTDEDSMQENSQILIENIQSKGNDVKETQQDIVYKNTVMMTAMVMKKMTMTRMWWRELRNKCHLMDETKE